MRLGISTYCLERLLQSGEMTLGDVLRWAGDQGAGLVELVPFSFSFLGEEGILDETLIARTRETAKEAGVDLSGYSISANFCLPEGEAFEAEVRRVCRHIDAVQALGIPRMRHDLAGYRPDRAANGPIAFDQQLPRIAEGARRVTAYARSKGVATMVENHGFFVNGSDRLERLLSLVNDDNFSLLLDTGNIVCVDEDPAIAAGRLAPYAHYLHLKDFYLRKTDPGSAPGMEIPGGWFRSIGGRYLRGSILGQGDLDVQEVLGVIKGTGYDGPIALEFEGMESPLYATKVSLNNAQRLWDEA